MHQAVDSKVQELVKELQHLFGERLVSVCVYGSAVFRDEEVTELSSKHQNINVMVILKGLDAKDLEKSSSISKWWEKVGHSLPMFLSEEEWYRSADVFALEYADIKDTHKLAYGKDLYSQTQVDREALRLVCELELHRKLIFLRQRLLLHRDNPKVLLELLQGSVNSFAALFRGVLRLKLEEGPVPQKSQAVFEAMKDIVSGYDATPFLRVLSSKAPHTRIALTDVFALFTQFIQQVGLVTAYTDECFGFVSKKEGVRL